MPISKVQKGDLVTSSAWNNMVDEINLKTNRAEDTFSGALTITGKLAANGGLTATSATFSGNLDVRGGLTGTNAGFSGNLQANGHLTGNTASFSEIKAKKVDLGTAGNITSCGPGGSWIQYVSISHYWTNLAGRELMYLDSGGNLGVSGSVVKPSDARLKQNIKKIEHALDRLTQLRGVTFEWKNPENHCNDARVQIGMIAQEVETVFPNWVSERDGVKSVGTTGFEGLVVEALKELKQRIVRMEAVLHLAV